MHFASLPFLRRRVWIIVALASAWLPPAQAAPTIAQLRGYAFPLEVVSAPQAGRVAWTSEQRGLRNVWIAEAPAYAPRRLTDYAQDDGQTLSSLAISADGRRIVYVRGGEHGGNWDRGKPFNPASLPAGEKVEIWSIDSAGGAPKRLAEGDYPVLSPDGTRVAFVRDGQPWQVPADGSAEPRQLLSTRGRVGSLAWSPDGRALAFVADRDSHALIGIYRSAEVPITWVDASVGFDGQPRWSPDGRQLLFARRPPARKPEDSRAIARPWSIWQADAETGAARERWRSGNERRDSYPGDLLEWAEGGSIVFASYRDGWMHLYALAPAAAEPRLLTPGDFQVEQARLSADRRSLVYIANTGPSADDGERRHVFRVAADGASPPSMLSVGSGSEWSPVEARGQWLCVSADARRPPLLALLGGDGTPRLLERADPDYPVDALVVPRRVQFRAEDGNLVHAQLFAPAQVAGRRQAVVFVHGGPQRQMLLGWHYSDYYANTYAVNQYLAGHGFVVLSVNYRLGPGYGFDYHFPLQAGSEGGAEYRDIRAAGRYLQGLAQVDPQRIGIYGGSYGGYLTAMALAHDSELFKAGVDIHGVHDWTSDDRQAFEPQRYDSPEQAERARRIAWEASPVAAVAGWKSPVLFIHGDDDRNVHVEQTIDLVRQLDGRGVDDSVILLPDESHHLVRYANTLRVDEATVRFFEEHLGDAAAAGRSAAAEAP
ncbi:MAG: alpha/beta fold hydrolase [Pseudoxanthomonas sp.]